MSDLFRVNPPSVPAPPPLPPPAPPLPPQGKYATKATNALARFAQPLFYSSRPPSAQALRGDGSSIGARSADAPRLSSPLSSQTTVHRTGIPIAALDISPQRTHAIVAGREILKTIRVSGPNCAEEFNLRSAIIAYASTHSVGGGAISAKHKDQLSATDVKWSNGRFDAVVATAAANGRVVVYDVTRPGLEVGRLHEHSRQVHKIAFNPHNGAYLLSGSQDSSVRLWDMRDLWAGKSVMTCRSAAKYLGNSDGIRDVRWSPTDGVAFAIGTDSGTIQRWDMRKANTAMLKINAHEKACFSVDWHPGGKNLVSAGVDKTVKVWDLDSPNRRQKPAWNFRCPQGIMNVRWRPAVWSAASRAGGGGWESSQLVTSYINRDPRIHLWDFRRPHIPYKELDRYNNEPTDLLWHSENLLWTVGTEGVFQQTDIHFAPKVIDRRSFSAVACAPDGEVAFFTQQRPGRHSVVDFEEKGEGLSGAGRSKSSSDRFASSRSATDDSVDDAFLSSSYKRHHGRTASTKSLKSAGSTPPSGSTTNFIYLAETLEKYGGYEPDQLFASGHIPGSLDADAFKYLAEKYLEAIYLRPSAVMELELDFRMQQVFERNAQHAEAQGFYRLAQTWRIIGLAAAKELRERKEEKQRVLAKGRSAQTAHTKGDMGTPIMGGKKTDTTAKPTPNMVPNGLAASRRLRRGSDTPSTLATPLARPVADSPTTVTRGSALRSSLADIDDEDTPALPPPAYGSSGSTDSSSTTQSQHKLDDAQQPSPLQPSSFFGPRWYDSEQEMAERRANMSSYQVQPKPVLSLDPPRSDQSLTTNRPSFDRHDSTESFDMFSASAGSSSHPNRSLASSFGDHMNHPLHESSPGEWAEEPSSGGYGYYDAPAPLESLNPQEPSANNSSSESESQPSAPVVTHIRPSSSSTHDDQLEASGTIIPESPAPKPTISDIPPQTDEYTFTLIDPSRDIDFLPDGEESELTSPLTSTPWNLSNMLRTLIEFHSTRLNDVQLPAVLLVLLRPLLPRDAIPPVQVQAILSRYHSQLIDLQLHTDAALLRKICYPEMEAVYEAGLRGTHVGLLCQGCAKPLQNTRTKRPSWVCENCQGVQAPCPICRLHEKKAGMRLWAWCQGCGHGGHADCMHVWWASGEDGEDFSEGGCAVMGCLHDCMPGERRRMRLEERQKGDHTPARRDSWVAHESRAVERVRSAIGNGVPTAAMNIQSGQASGGRRVRLLAPSDG